MGWPRAGDYDAAIQSSPGCFGDQDLARGRPVQSAILPGQLLSYSGNFACVFKLAGPGGQAWAVKCFTRPVTDQQERYRAISEHLAGNPRKFAVDFRYLAEGIRVGGAWYPVLKMRWVEGAHLNELLAEHAGNASLLRQMSGLWLRLAAELREAKMAHGDIQHGNVLLVPAAQAGKVAVRLVDYDGMWVPPLNGKPPGEVGHPNYQHPARLKQGGYFSEIDRFAHLVVYTTLQCLRSGGKGLWARHDSGENLLFRRADFDNPAASKLLPELMELPDPHARSLVGHLIDAAGGPLYRVPLLSELVDGDAVAPLSAEQVERLKGLAPSARWSPASPPQPVPAPVPGPAPPEAVRAGGETRPVPVPALPPGGPPPAVPAPDAVLFALPRGPGPQTRREGGASQPEVAAPRQGLAWPKPPAWLLRLGLPADHPLGRYWLAVPCAAVVLLLLVGLWLLRPSSRRPEAREKPRPEARLVLPGEVSLEAGKSATVEVRLERAGHDGPVVLRVLDLPACVVLSNAVIVPGSETLAKVRLATSLDGARQGLYQVRVVALVDGKQVGEQALTLRLEAPPVEAREVTNSIGMKLVLVPTGNYWMGSLREEAGRNNDEGPRRKVAIRKSFYLGACEVTQEEYEKVMGSNPSHFSATGAGKDEVKGLDTRRFPVERVSWEDAVAFCKKLSELPEEKEAGRVYRLPTEAEWEYACRAGTTTAFAFGDWLTATQARLSTSTCAVAGFRPNAWGLYDMHGNVAEWCQDAYYAEAYRLPVSPDTRAPELGPSRVCRGGNWRDRAPACRSAARGASAPGVGSNAIGFRVAAVLSIPDRKAGPEVRLVLPGEVVLEPGKTDTVEVRLERRGHDGPVVLRLLDLPAGIAPVKDVTVPPGETLATFSLGVLRDGAGWEKSVVRVVALVDGEQVGQGALRLRLHRPAAVEPAREVTNSIGMKLVLIPAGKFTMGSPGTEKGRSPAEGPAHEVEITKPFYLGVFEVTQEEYRKVMGNNPSYFSSTGGGKKSVEGLDTGRFPVENVSWEEAVEFCKKLSELPDEKKAGRLYRLPTEAEWEYACRGGARETTSFHFGAWLFSVHANFNAGAAGGPSWGRPVTVGSYPKNGFGLADMHGNVWEWCADWYNKDYYGASPPAGPAGPAVGTTRVLRGGGWSNEERNCRSAFRGNGAPTLRLNNLGFRVALVPAGR